MKKNFGKSELKNEEPISTLLYYISYKISKLTNINPNYITTARLFLMLILYHQLYYGGKYIPALLLLTCYFLDHLDGEMARQNNRVTIFGDYYDHIVDQLYMLPLFYLLYLKFKYHKHLKIIIFVFIALMVTSTVLVGCQELIFTKTKKNVKSQSLNIITKLCVVNDLQILKFFGQGLLHAFLICLILY